MWLAFDIGTSGAKAALIESDGRVVESAFAGYDTSTADGGVVEQNAADWWQAMVATCGQLNLSGVSLEGVAVTGQMQDVILLDADMQPVRPVILYSDTRARDEAAAYVKSVDVETLRFQAGNKQGEGPDGLPAKLMWLANHEPDSVSKAVHVMIGAADFGVHRLTGQLYTDTTTASTTGLMNMTTRKLLSSDLLPDAASVMLTKLPPVVPGGSLAGTVTDMASGALGIPAGTPVYIGPGDAGATASGAIGAAERAVYAYIGTSGWVAFTAGQPASFDSGVITIAHPQPDTLIQVAPLLTAAGNVDWLCSALGAASIESLIERMAPQPVDTIYLPYLNGERSPFVDPLARAAFIGIGATSDAPALTRAVLTGVAYGYRHALEALVAHTSESLTVTGGGTASRAWTQIFADVLGIPVQVAADAQHVGVRGVVFAAQGSAAAVPIAETVQPDATHREFYDRQFEVFRAAYLALRPVFAQMAAE